MFNISFPYRGCERARVQLRRQANKTDAVLQERKKREAGWTVDNWPSGFLHFRAINAASERSCFRVSVCPYPTGVGLVFLSARSKLPARRSSRDSPLFVSLSLFSTERKYFQHARKLLRREIKRERSRFSAASKRNDCRCCWLPSCSIRENTGGCLRLQLAIVVTAQHTSIYKLFYAFGKLTEVVWTRHSKARYLLYLSSIK